MLKRKVITNQLLASFILAFIFSIENFAINITKYLQIFLFFFSFLLFRITLANFYAWACFWDEVDYIPLSLKGRGGISKIKGALPIILALIAWLSNGQIKIPIGGRLYVRIGFQKGKDKLKVEKERGKVVVFVLLLSFSLLFLFYFLWKEMYPVLLLFSFFQLIPFFSFEGSYLFLNKPIVWIIMLAMAFGSLLFEASCISVWLVFLNLMTCIILLVY